MHSNLLSTVSAFAKRAVTPAGAVAASIVAGCAAVEVEAYPPSEIVRSDLESFAWGAAEAEPEDLNLDLAIRAAVDRELAALGVPRAPSGEAAVLISYDLVVEEKHRNNDPYFDVHVAERYELGTMSVSIRDGASGEILWRASGTSELRTSAVVVGPLAPKLEPTDHARDWRVDEKVGAIFAELHKALRRNAG